MIRTPREIASQAIIYGALGVRASLEITEHARSAEISSRLLPWLEEIGLEGRIEEYHREILELPHGQLPSDFRTEAYWRGESAALLGWAVQVFDMPDRQQAIAAELLVDRLKLGRPEAVDLLNKATLRPEAEIEEFCAFCLAVRLQLQQSSVSAEIAQTLDAIYRKRMTELGLHDFNRAIEQAAIFAANTVPPPLGLYVVRALSAEWLLGKDDAEANAPDRPGDLRTRGSKSATGLKLPATREAVNAAA